MARRGGAGHREDPWEREEQGKEILRASCLKLAMLRKLIVGTGGQERSTAIAKVAGLLERNCPLPGVDHHDATFVAEYAGLCEEDAARP